MAVAKLISDDVRKLAPAYSKQIDGYVQGNRLIASDAAEAEIATLQLRVRGPKDPVEARHRLARGNSSLRAAEQGR
jgi:hypothetical protein